MATRTGNLIDNNNNTWTAAWVGLTDADSDDGAPVAVGMFGMLMAQAVGDFDAGGEITMQVSNDGETWATAVDHLGADVVLDADGAMMIIAGNPAYIRPILSGGTSVDIDVLVNLSLDATGAGVVALGGLTSLVEDFVNTMNARAVATTAAAVLTDNQTIFTVSGGPIRVTDLFSYCVTVCDGTTATLTWSADGSATNQTETNFTGASGSLAAFAVGGIVYCNFTALNTAPVITQTAGVALYGPTTSTGGGIYVPVGTILTTVASGPTTGTFRHYMRYEPIHPDATVTAAF